MGFRETLRSIPKYRQVLGLCAGVAAAFAVGGLLLNHYARIPLPIIFLAGSLCGFVCARSANSAIGGIMTPATRFLTITAFSLPGAALALGGVASLLLGNPA